MTPIDPNVARIVSGALAIVAAALPGFLAALAGAESDAEALDRAERRLGEIPTSPAQRGVDRARGA